MATENRRITPQTESEKNPQDAKRNTDDGTEDQARALKVKTQPASNRLGHHRVEKQPPERDAVGWMKIAHGLREK